MKKAKSITYGIIGAILVFIITFVALYSTYTYSVNSENNVTVTSNEELLGYEEDDEEYVVDIYEKYYSEKSNEVTNFMDCDLDDNDNLVECTLKNIPIDRNQHGGTCWAISATNIIEATLANKYKLTSYGNTTRINPYHMLLSLERKLYDEDMLNQINNKYGFRNQAAAYSGGTDLNIILYLTNGTGFTTDPRYDYHKSDENTNFNNYYKLSDVIDNRIETGFLNNTSGILDNYYVKELRYVPGISNYNEQNNPNGTNYDNPNSLLEDNNVINKITQVKNTLGEGIGVRVVAYAPNTHYNQNEVNPCYNNNNRAIYCGNSVSDLGLHAMAIVGWDDEYPVENFAEGNYPPAPGAWIMRNSWGNDYFYYLSYYDYMFLSHDEMIITNISEREFDNIYQYNPSGCKTQNMNTYGNASSLDRIYQKQIANIYTRNNHDKVEKLENVSFYAMPNGDNTKIEIYYKQGNVVDDSLYDSGNKIGELNISTKGFYTLDIDRDILITNNKFIIGLKSSKNWSLFVQRKSQPDMTNEEVGIIPGISYYKTDEWEDLNTYWINTDEGRVTVPSTAFIKAYTVVTNEEIVPVTGISLSYSGNPIFDGFSMPMVVNSLGKLEATVLPANATNKNVIWSSSNTNVATIDEEGNFRVIGIGNTTIAATTEDGGYSQTFKIVVANLAQSVSLNKENLTLNLGASERLVATINPSNATNQTVTWSSSNSNVATVNTSGNVTAISAGTATITARTSNGKTATCTVKVNVPVTEISLKINNVAIDDIDTYPVVAPYTGTVIAVLSPENATNKNVTWSSSNLNVATINSNGRINSVGPGTTVITATADNGEYRKSFNLYVMVNPQSISLNKENLTLNLGASERLIATIEPSNTNNQTLTWTSSNPSIATVDTNGLVTAIKKGTTTITVRTSNGKTATCTVKVNIPVTGIEFQEENLTIKVTKSASIHYVIEPYNATNKNIIWKSSNPRVATVSNGTVSGLSAGTTIITAETEDGGYKATCNVTVTNTENIPVTGVTISPLIYTIRINTQYILSYNVLPENATNKNVTFTSSKPAIATVDSSGIVTAKKVGTTTITITTNDGNYKAKIKINVIKSNQAVAKESETIDDNTIYYVMVGTLLVGLFVVAGTIIIEKKKTIKRKSK